MLVELLFPKSPILRILPPSPVSLPILHFDFFPCSHAAVPNPFAFQLARSLLALWSARGFSMNCLAIQFAVFPLSLYLQFAILLHPPTHPIGQSVLQFSLVLTNKLCSTIVFVLVFDSVFAGFQPSAQLHLELPHFTLEASHFHVVLVLEFPSFCPQQ